MERRRFLVLAGAGVVGAAGVASWWFSRPSETTGGASQALDGPIQTPNEPISLTWTDLIPGGDRLQEQNERLFRVMDHGEDWAFAVNSELVSGYNGKRVSLPGYMVPLEFEPDGVRNFLLVPFIGACIHVPPPPPNQIVLVTSDTPYPADDYFDAVTVTGRFDQLGEDLDLAEVGYIIEADNVADYVF